MLDLPRVSCLMVTANRKKIAERAVMCFSRQTYPNKELVIIDDGEEDYSDILADIPSKDLKYVRIQQDDKVQLGELRNISLNEAQGDYLVQWDDDDWYHDDRIRMQAEVLQSGVEACFLSFSLTHIETEEYHDYPFIGCLKNGIPGSIMHVRNDDIRYPNYLKGEDTVYLNSWSEKKSQAMGRSMAYLFIRCYHGTNTWDLQHFSRRMRNSPYKMVLYGWYRYLRNNLARHPHFRMEGMLTESVQQFMDDSRELNIFEQK